MPQLIPTPLPDAAKHYANQFRTGRVSGAINIAHLRECAALSADLRNAMARYFGWQRQEVETLPQIQKKQKVDLVTGSKKQTCLETVTFIRTERGFWRIEHADGRRAYITPGPNVLIGREGANKGVDLFTGKPSK